MQHKVSPQLPQDLLFFFFFFEVYETSNCDLRLRAHLQCTPAIISQALEAVASLGSCRSPQNLQTESSAQGGMRKSH